MFKVMGKSSLLLSLVKRAGSNHEIHGYSFPWFTVLLDQIAKTIGKLSDREVRVNRQIAP
jgi:hypothetical protein